MDDNLSVFIKTELINSGSVIIDEDTSLFAYGLDSIKMMRLVSYLESTFGISIPDEDVNYDNMSTINNIRQVVQNSKKSSAS